MKKFAMLFGAVTSTAALVRLPYHVAQSGGADQQFTIILTASATALVAIVMWWWSISEIALWHAHQRQHRGTLLALAKFATPRARRAAAASLAVPALAFSSPAFANDDVPDRPETTVDLSWGAEVESQDETPTNGDTPSASTALAPRPSANPDLSRLAQHSVWRDQTRADDVEEAPNHDDSNASHGSKTSESGTRVVVRPGDSLWSIATRHTAHADQIPDLIIRIWESNRTVIGENPNYILPGQEILIP